MDCGYSDKIEPLSIAYVLPEFLTEKSAGGIATHYDIISRILADSGNNIVIFVLSDKNEIINYYHNVVVERVFFDKSDVNAQIPGSYIRFWSRQINNKVRDYKNKGNKIDIIQYPNYMGLGFDRLEDVPTVIRISSFQPYWRAASKIDFDIHGEYRSQSAADYIELLSVIKADAVYGPSRVMASLFKKESGTDISVIESPFYPNNTNCELDNLTVNVRLPDRYIITPCTLNLIKGIKLIGDSIWEILDKNKNLYWVFAGTEMPWEDCGGNSIAPSEYVSEKAGDYKERVIFLGKVAHDYLMKIMEVAELCVLPSRIDNLPNSCIEAMALGKVVIGTDGASFEQLIEDGENGFLIARENSEDLIRTVNVALGLGKDNKHRIGENAKKRIEKMSPDYIGGKLIGLYTDTISRFKREKKYETNNRYVSICDKYNKIIRDYDEEYVIKY